MHNNAEKSAGDAGQIIDLNHWLTAANDECSDTFTFLKDKIKQQLADGCREIHLEQEPGLCRLRCRANGQLDETRLVADSLVVDLINTFSVLTGRNTAVLPHGFSAWAGQGKDRREETAKTHTEEHGEFTFKTIVDGGQCHVDAIYYPTASGISLTLSLTNESTLPETLDQTTLNASSIHTLRDHFAAIPHGITLICSPDGCALQNIFYAVLCETNAIERKTISIERRVHKNISRISQLQTSGECRDSTKASQLASRHADQIFIAWEGAQHAALVNDLVSDYRPASIFIRAKDASGAIRQLIDHGIKENQLASSITAVVEVSECRTICPHCADSHVLTSREMQWLENSTLFHEPDACESFVYAPGCERCDHTGSDSTLTLASYCKCSEDLVDAIESRSMPKMDEALKSSQGTGSLAHQLETLVRNGKASFTEFRHR